MNTLIELVGVVFVTAVVVASVVYLVINKKLKEAEQKIKDLQTPERMKMFEEGFNAANEQTKMLINLVANMVGFLYTSIPVSEDSKGVMREILELLNEIRDGVPADTKIVPGNTDPHVTL